MTSHVTSHVQSKPLHRSLEPKGPQVNQDQDINQLTHFIQ